MAEPDKEPKTKEARAAAKKFHLCLDNKLVTQKEVSFASNSGDNTMTSKRSIARIGYMPGFFKNTQFYLNLGSVSMGFDQAVNMGPHTTLKKFEKAVAFAYGAGISSNVYNLPESTLGLKVDLGFLRYSPKIEGNDEGQDLSATAEVTEYQLAADTIYQGFSKFSPYLGLLYAKSSGNLAVSDPDEPVPEVNFDEKNQFGCRLGTGYNLRDNVKLTAEYRLLDESALSFLINYAF